MGHQPSSSAASSNAEVAPATTEVHATGTAGTIPQAEKQHKKEFWCARDDCDAEFDQEYELKFHIHTRKHYTCYDCRIPFAKIELLHAHFEVCPTKKKKKKMQQVSSIQQPVPPVQAAIQPNMYPIQFVPPLPSNPPPPSNPPEVVTRQVSPLCYPVPPAYMMVPPMPPLLLATMNPSAVRFEPPLPLGSMNPSAAAFEPLLPLGTMNLSAVPFEPSLPLGTMNPSAAAFEPTFFQQEPPTTSVVEEEHPHHEEDNLESMEMMVHSVIKEDDDEEEETKEQETFICRYEDCGVTLESQIAFRKHAMTRGHFVCDTCSKQFCIMRVWRSHQESCQVTNTTEAATTAPTAAIPSSDSLRTTPSTAEAERPSFGSPILVGAMIQDLLATTSLAVSRKKKEMLKIQMEPGVVYDGELLPRYIYMDMDNIWTSMVTSDGFLHELVRNGTCGRNLRLHLNGFTSRVDGNHGASIENRTAFYYNTPPNLVRRLCEEYGWASERQETRSDTHMHLKLLMNKKPVVDRFCKTFVLLTGDGNTQQSTKTSFPFIVEQYLEVGWHVEVHSWSCNLHHLYIKLQRTYPQHFVVRLLDENDDILNQVVIDKSIIVGNNMDIHEVEEDNYHPIVPSLIEQTRDELWKRRIMLSCPIGMELYRDPVSVSCCGRIFSKKALLEYQEAHVLSSSSSSTTSIGCPLCGQHNYTTLPNVRIQLEVQRLEDEYRRFRNGTGMSYES